MNLKKSIDKAIVGEAGAVDMSYEIIESWQADGHPVPRDMMSIFFLINSSSDHLPILGRENFWNKESLAKKEKEKKVLDDFYESDFIESCQAIRNYLDEMK